MGFERCRPVLRIVRLKPLLRVCTVNKVNLYINTFCNIAKKRWDSKFENVELIILRKIVLSHPTKKEYTTVHRLEYCANSHHPSPITRPLTQFNERIVITKVFFLLKKETYSGPKSNRLTPTNPSPSSIYALHHYEATTSSKTILFRNGEYRGVANARSLRGGPPKMVKLEHRE